MSLTLPAYANEAATLTQLRQQIDELRQQYETRLKALEEKLNQVQQSQTPSVQTTTAPEPALADPVASTPSPRKGNSAFNPAIGLVLSGTYANLSKDPASWTIPGFIPGSGELGPGSRSFSLGESELILSANIDHLAYGSLTVALAPDDSVAVEEGFVQTTALPGGLTLKAGRFYSGLGYLNEHHTHTWDFVDAPLTHQAFLGGQYKQDGLQAKWLLPTEQFVELGLELGNGAHFPGNDRNRNGAGSMALTAHTGGDIGLSHSWRLGASWLQTKALAREWSPDEGLTLNRFSGTSRLWVLDGVWKWAPNGNAQVRNFKLQGEYFRRIESGDLDVAGTTDAYRSAQSGWYLQGVYQFMPQWRVGLRHDRLDTGSLRLGAQLDGLYAHTDATPHRNSLMLDWSPSEFQRWRIQLSDDRVRPGVKDTQLFLQYQMSLGAHGAHSF